jgi:hypothetical protein
MGNNSQYCRYILERQNIWFTSSEKGIQGREGAMWTIIYKEGFVNEG